VHHVFAGIANGAIYRGAYDASVAGQIAWEEKPDFDGRIRRPMAAAEADGALYLTVDPEPSQPGNGGLFRRVDGPRPRWDWIYEWAWSSPNPDMPMWTGMRGLTPLRDPRDGHDVLLGAREQPGVIERIDPSRNHAVTLELDVRNYFSKIWYGGQLYRDVTLIAYNDMTAAVHPKTGEPIHLIGLWVLHPERQSELGASSWYLVRYRDGSYAHGRVFDPGDSTIRRGAACAAPGQSSSPRLPKTAHASFTSAASMRTEAHTRIPPGSTGLRRPNEPYPASVPVLSGTQADAVCRFARFRR